MLALRFQIIFDRKSSETESEQIFPPISAEKFISLGVESHESNETSFNHNYCEMSLTPCPDHMLSKFATP